MRSYGKCTIKVSISETTDAVKNTYVGFTSAPKYSYILSLVVLYKKKYEKPQKIEP